MTKDDNTTFSSSAWAKAAARAVIERFDDAAAIDTATYYECDVILSALKVVLRSPQLLNEAGREMEAPRDMQHFDKLTQTRGKPND